MSDTSNPQQGGESEPISEVDMFSKDFLDLASRFKKYIPSEQWLILYNNDLIPAILKFTLVESLEKQP